MPMDILAHSTLLWTLVAAQIAMGAFDIVFHHEVTERLSWSRSAAKELRLHAARNALYALLFGGLAWLKPTGLLAAALIAVLVCEILITLWDFVEEDRTRKLPPSERVLHTLLALNYGAILAIVLPVFGTWASEPTGLSPVAYGFASVVLSIAGLGCAGFALRDVVTGRRAASLVDSPPPSLHRLLPGRKRVLVTGATGFVGSRLVAALGRSGHEVIALVRSLDRTRHLPTPITLVTRLDQISRDLPVDAVVHLAGEPVAAWPWTRGRRLRILRSRLKLTRQLRAWIASRPETLRPAVQVTASAIGFYGDRGEEVLTERDRGGEGFAATLCRSIERETAETMPLGVRVVSLRIGLVMSSRGGALARMMTAFDLALGGPIGDGRQWMSWIGRDDLVRLVAHVIASSHLQGPVNATAPHPLRNAEFAHTLGLALRRPTWISIPSFVLRSVFGEMAESLFLASQRVLPADALASGFVFETPTFNRVLTAELPSRPARVRHRDPGRRRPRIWMLRG